MERSKRIGTFKEFLRQQRQKKINEENLSVECEWWDECVVEILQDINDECYGSLDYDTLIKYVKGKFQILGREEPSYEEALLLQHIKDLIFQHHGDSLYTTGTCDYGEGKVGIQAKGLVVGELAKVILDKVLDSCKKTGVTPKDTTTVTLMDKEPITMVPMTQAITYDEFEDELPFEHKRPVKKFEQYTKLK